MANLTLLVSQLQALSLSERILEIHKKILIHDQWSSLPFKWTPNHNIDIASSEQEIFFEKPVHGFCHSRCGKFTGLYDVSKSDVILIKLFLLFGKFRYNFFILLVSLESKVTRPLLNADATMCNFNILFVGFQAISSAKDWYVCT